MDLVGNDLTLLEIEEYIPSRIGTRSFIDLLAKDGRNRWVLIELKRSDAASREAIHEIYKYVEAVKSHFGARDDEIRAIIISTEWKELLVPFSRFVNDTDISVSGRKLVVDDATSSLIGSEEVIPLSVTSGRILSPWHEISLYTSKDRLTKGIKSYDKCCKAKGILDYVMIEMQAPDGFHRASVLAVAKSLHAIQGGQGEPPKALIEDMASKMDKLEHIIYFVPRILSEDEYIDIIKIDKDVFEEVKEWRDIYEGDELLSSLQEHAMYVEPRVDRDYFEVGYPAKFYTKLLTDEGWSIIAIHRRGAFARNKVLADDTIIGEIAGDAGTTGQRLKRSIQLSDKAEYAQLCKDVEQCLENNPVWKDAVRSQLAEARVEFPNCYVDVSIFTPTTGIFTLLFVMRENGILYAPSYSLTVKDGNDIKRIYLGELFPEDDSVMGPSDFSTVISKYYSGDLGQLVMYMNSGGYESRDIDILEDVGLIYGTYRCDIDGDDRTFFRVKNGRWRPDDQVIPFEGFKTYLLRNERLLRIIHAKLSPRIGGGICDGSSAVGQLKEVVDEAIANAGKEYISPPIDCDICTMPLSEELFISDGRLRENTVWATMCADCTVYHGAGIGWDMGQLYRKSPAGTWILVAGSNPATEGDE